METKEFQISLNLGVLKSVTAYCTVDSTGLKKVEVEHGADTFTDITQLVIDYNAVERIEEILKGEL